MTRLSTTITLILCLLSVMLTARDVNAQTCQSFESPQYDTAHAKDGQASLRWDTAQPLTLPIEKNGDSWWATSNDGLEFWLYRAAPDKVSLTLSISNMPNSKPLTIHQHFTGWRCVTLDLSEDMGPIDRQVQPVFQLHRNDASSDTLWLDRLRVGFRPLWHRTADRVVPTINAKREGGAHKYRLLRYATASWPTDITPPPDTQLASRNTITHRLDDWLVGTHANVDHPLIQSRLVFCNQVLFAEALQCYDTLQLDTQDQHPRGLYADRDPSRPDVESTYKFVFEKVLGPLALAYRTPGGNTPETENPLFCSPILRDKLMRLFDYVQDQGWAEGSSHATGYFASLSQIGYAVAVFLCRDELAQTGRLERELATLAWYAKFRQMVLPTDQHWGENTDDVRAILLSRLVVALLEPDTARSVMYLSQIQHWLDRVCTVQDGFKPVFKPDGTVIHHLASYLRGYGHAALHQLSVYAWLSRDTDYALPVASLDLIKFVLMRNRLPIHSLDATFNNSGRWPFGTSVWDESFTAYAYLALAMSHDNQPDAQLASVFARLYVPEQPLVARYLQGTKFRTVYVRSLGDLDMLSRLDQLGLNVPAEPMPQGFFVFPQSGMAVYRVNDSTAVIKGFSRYVWDFEWAGTRDNPDGRYLSHGSLAIHRGDMLSTQTTNGIIESGWDFSHWPGTTTPTLNHDQLRDLKHDRNFSDTVFLGGVQTSQGDGVFAMQLHDPQSSVPITAKKSWFAHGGMLICLGSDITSSSATPVTTTLFQCNGLPAVTSTLPVLCDPMGTRYVVTDTSNIKQTPTMAYIDHGISPDHARYAYTVLLDKSLPDQPAYTILRQDSAVHAVSVRDSAWLGMAIFDANVDVHVGPVLQSDTPVVLTLAGDQLAVSDPDFGHAWNLPKIPTFEELFEDRQLRNQPYASRIITLTLKGRWQSDGADAVQHLGNTTQIKLSLSQGRTCQLTLIQP